MTGPQWIECPWCGREIALRVNALAPRHKRVTTVRGATRTKLVRWCPGGGELPLSLSPDQRRYLRTRWFRGSDSVT